MKKTIRLTEADLVRLVKRVVNEQEGVNRDMSLSEFTKKYVSLQRALFKKLGVPFSIEDSKMEAKEIYEREPAGEHEEIINSFSEIVKSAREHFN